MAAQTGIMVAQTGIMAAELANNYKQTKLMEKKLQQDLELAILQINHENEANLQNQEVMRELNTRTVNVMVKIEERLGDISEKLDQIGRYIRIGSK